MTGKKQDEQIDHIGQLKPDLHNARIHTPRNIGMITASLQKVGSARSIVIDEDDVILAGNGVIEAAADAGIERVRVIESDGHEIIAVRRTGLSNEQKRLLAYYDNRTGELSSWDAVQIASDLEEGIDLTGIFNQADLSSLSAVSTLDQLEDEFGEPDPTAGWPFVRVQVSPDTLELYESLMAQASGETLAAKFERLLQCVDTTSL